MDTKLYMPTSYTQSAYLLSHSVTSRTTVQIWEAQLLSATYLQHVATCLKVHCFLFHQQSQMC